MLRSDLCDFSNAYIIVKGTITFTEADDAKSNKEVTFKNNHHLLIAFQKLMA